MDDAEAKKGLRLVWFGIGKDDFLLSTSNATVSMLKKHKFDVVSKETAGGHTWINWRDYLHELCPASLFREVTASHSSALLRRSVLGRTLASPSH